MTDETQLRLQIQQEIDREAKIDRMIEAKVKKNLKENRQFYRVSQRKGCDGIMIFYRDNLLKYYMVLNGEKNTFLDDPNFLDGITLVFVKNKNKHDNTLHTYSFLIDCEPSKKYSKYSKLK